MKFAMAAFVFFALSPAVAAASDRGPKLYATYCSSCHGDRGQGSNVAPSLIGRPAVDVHFMLDSGRMPASAPNVNEIPRAPRFTEVQIAALVAYILTFSPQPPPSELPLIMPGNLRRGRELFAENCAQCHGAAGNGASVGADNVAPSLATATVFQVGEAIRAGPGVMPRFGPDVLSASDVDDIAHYVNFMQTHGNIPDGPNAGGFSLAHTGPVAEGFIAWLCGLGALVLFVRRIGTAGDDTNGPEPPAS
ncbi:MAG TPA: c-type cytochrome [Candidatus Cybelea sp.]|jgi:ubiquinol-cytochrome c reductase cytochrome c subunit|nr:c-type cytochrome [Candidatus Cybelea sp.]